MLLSFAFLVAWTVITVGCVTGLLPKKDLVITGCLLAMGSIVVMHMEPTAVDHLTFLWCVGLAGVLYMAIGLAQIWGLMETPGDQE